MTWAEFWKAHGGGNYTPVFNTFLDSQIVDERLPLLLRVLAWVLRNSWGRHSSECVNAEGIRAGQVDSARDLRVLDKDGKPDRRKIGPVFGQLERMNLIRFEGRDILLVDNPCGVFAESSPKRDPHSDIERKNGEQTVLYFLETVWKVSKPTAYEAYQSAERQYKELRTALMRDFKKSLEKSERGATNGSESRKEGRQAVGMRADNASERGATNSGASLSRTENLKVSPSSSFSLVREAVRQYAPEPDDDALKQMVQACRSECEDCSEPEIAHFIHVKAKLLKPHIGNVVGFFLKAVPRCFEADSIRAYRERKKNANGVPHNEPTISEQIEDLENLLSASPRHSQAEEWRAQLAVLRSRKPADSEPSAMAQKAGQA